MIAEENLEGEDVNRSKTIRECCLLPLQVAAKGTFHLPPIRWLDLELIGFCWHWLSDWSSLLQCQKWNRQPSHYKLIVSNQSIPDAVIASIFLSDIIHDYTPHTVAMLRSQKYRYPLCQNLITVKAQDPMLPWIYRPGDGVPFPVDDQWAPHPLQQESSCSLSRCRFACSRSLLDIFLSSHILRASRCRDCVHDIWNQVEELTTHHRGRWHLCYNNRAQELHW